MRSTVFLVLLFLACAFGQSTFDTKIAAHWSLPCTSTSSLYSSLPYNDPSACRLNPAEQAASYLSTPVSVTWGVGVYGANYASTLTFDPYDAVTLKLYNGNVAQSAVPIGVLTHFNYPINCYDDCNKYIPTNFVLGLYVNVQVGTDKATYKGDFTMFLDETPNVDGRSPLSSPCSYNPHETSWDAFTGNVGYTSDYPCCPYYTAKAVPNGAISLNGPCSDRLKFTTTANFNEFVILGTKYTLVIAGFSSSNTVFNADVTFFTSQENQSQQAYIWAYVTRKCTDSSACNDNQQCTTNTCNTNTGLCEYAAVANGAVCTDPKTTYYSDVCTKFKCKSGTCYGSLLPEDGSCVNSAARPTGKTTDCSRSVCKSGFCTWSNWRTGSSCATGPAFTDQQCQKKTCNLGSCRLGSGNTGNTCTPASADAQAALAAASPCNSAICVASSSGTCKFSTQTGGSCTQVSTSVCNRRICKTKVVNLLTVGTCRGSFVGNTGSCQATGNGAPAATLCQQRKCVNNAGVGSCRFSVGPDGGSCVTGNGALTTTVQCKARTCLNGACTYTPNDSQGSCTNPALTLAQCWKRQCKSGTCGLTVNAAQGSCTNAAITKAECKKLACNSAGACVGTANPNQGSCTGPSPVECKKRICANGVCTPTSNDVQGSCTNAAITKAECQKIICKGGVCVGTANSNQGSCTGPTPVQCKKRVCSNGACTPTSNDVQGSCTNPALTKAECQKIICKGGVCVGTANSNQGSCTGPTPVQCKKRVCSNGVCTPTSNDIQGSCTNPALTKAECQKIICKGGVCVGTANANQGSCTNAALTKAECQKIICKSGNCVGTANSNQGSCTGPTPVQCKKRVCSNGVCTPTSNDIQGSCTNPALTKAECNKIICKGGVCVGTANANQGSCTNAALTKAECKKIICKSGNCVGTANSNQGSCFSLTARWCYKRVCASGVCGSSVAARGGSCSGAGINAVECQKRVCNGAGVCTGSVAYTGGSCSSVLTIKKSCYKRVCNGGTCNYAPNDVQGSCQATGAGGAFPVVVCKKRACSSGSCSYQSNDPQGSCFVDAVGSALASRDCKKRGCASGLCVYSDNTVSGGSCSSSWVGNSQTSVNIVFCNKRNCDTRGTCKYVANLGETAGSCRTLPFKECNKRQCRTVSGKSTPGSCGYDPFFAGSCTGMATAECKIRQCDSSATCSFTAVGNGGSCTGAYDSSSYAGMSASCTKRVCNNGACSLSTSNIGGTCNTGKTSNDYTCFKQRCKTKSGVSGGTCSTSASPNTQSCTAAGAYSNTECRVAKCDGTGSCRYNYNNFGQTVACTSLTDKVCAPERCNGQGTCVYRNDLKEGNTGCLATDATTVFCTDSKCQSGECVDVSDVSKNASTVCKTSAAGEDTCKNYYCLYKNPSSTSNKLGTCVRLKDPSQVNQKCSSAAFSGASTEDARCFNLLCDSTGVCQRQNRADGVFCATPPNTEVNNGYGCSQYVCKSGTCNTAAAVPIKNGTNCAGWLPCDPSTPACLAECQRFICFNGVCQVDYFKENQNCTYIKYLTARSEDGSIVEEEEARDSENGGVTANECTQGKCYQGRCAAVTVKNGTACGNRTKYNDLCYGDYCNAQGRCVNTGRRNCQGVLPLPSVCWDVTCEASSGDCVLRANGVVDCSCIFDCSACTAKLQSNGRKLACWWCTGDQNGKAGCFNRRLPGQTGDDTAPPQGHGKCYKDNSPCAGDNGLSGGQVAGIVVGILGLTSLALLVIALLIMAIRYFAAPAAPPANASLTDLAFDKNVKNNVFYKGANLEMFSSVYAEPKFITT